MSKELANQEPSQSATQDMTNKPSEHQGNASIKFIQGIVDGYTDYANELTERRAKAHGLSTEALLEVRRFIEQATIQAKLSENGRIERAPGFRVVALLEFFCRRKTSERLIEPMHAEFLFEYYMALKAGHARKATWIKLQMRVCLISAVVSERFFHIIGKICAPAFKAKSDE